MCDSINVQRQEQKRDNLEENWGNLVGNVSNQPV